MIVVGTRTDRGLWIVQRTSKTNRLKAGKANDSVTGGIGRSHVDSGMRDTMFGMGL
jgi:hypothetical protein